MNTPDDNPRAGIVSRRLIERLVTILAVLAFLSNRLWIVFTGRCLVDSDEAIFGLMSMDALRGHFSAFYYGQDYMGSFQSLAAMPFIVILGASPLALRATAIAEGLGVLFCWKWLFRKWNVPTAWIPFAFLYACPPEFFATWSIRSRGGIELLLLGSLWLMVLTMITESIRPFEQETARWMALGFLTGISWWTNQLIIFFFLPAGLAFLLVRENRSRLVRFLRENGGFSKRSIILMVLTFYWTTLVILMARGTIHYRSYFSYLLYEYRWLLLILHALSVLLFLFSRKRLRIPGWPFAAGVGLLLAYSPALWRTFTHETLYNTTSLHNLGDLPINLACLFIMSGGCYVGLFAYNLQTLPLPSFLYVAIPCIYLIAIILVALNFFRQAVRDRRFPLGEMWLVSGFLLSIVLMGMIQHTYTRVSHYGLFSVFFLLLIVACFLSELWSISRVTTLVISTLLIYVNLLSVYRVPPAPIVKSRMVAQRDADLIDFVAGKGITAACTSLQDVAYGYWEAYRLSFAAGERIIVHPILHMPRIGRYREMLKEADRCAVITASPERVGEVFRKYDVPFQEDRFGDLTVVWGFDKKRVDELGLISYEARIKIPETRGAATSRISGKESL